MTDRIVPFYATSIRPNVWLDYFLNLSFNIKFLIMNKKFSTLMAGLMLASAFSVNAQTTNEPTAVSKYVSGKYYVLGDATNVLTVVSDAKDDAYGELKMVPKAGTWNLSATRDALWEVKVVAGQAGDAPKYSFVNVATGMTLSVPTPQNNTDKNTVAEGDELMISGGYMEWIQKWRSLCSEKYLC